jgi:hypothetical protein
MTTAEARARSSITAGSACISPTHSTSNTAATSCCGSWKCAVVSRAAPCSPSRTRAWRRSRGRTSSSRARGSGAVPATGCLGSTASSATAPVATAWRGSAAAMAQQSDTHGHITDQRRHLEERNKRRNVTYRHPLT